MKKTLVLVSTVLLFASLTFAQTQDKAAAPKTTTTTTATPAKDAKSGCDKKDMEKCGHAKEGKSCCAKDAKKATDTKAPEKK